MNKYLLTPFAAAALMLASCTQEEFVTNGSGDGNVVFTAQLPEGMNTRAFSDGYTATQLQYAVYDENGNHLDGYGDSETITLNNRKATVSLSLITGKEYTIVFWADAENSPYSFDKETGVVTVNSTTTTTDTDASDNTDTADYGDESASEDAATTDNVITGPSQDENRDAFFATESFKVTGSINKTITLTRPFAQINIGTSDIKEFTNAGGKITESGMTVKGYGKLNLLSGKADEEVTYEFYNVTLPNESFPYEASTYTTYLAMNYILVPADKQTVDVTWTSDNTNRKEVTFNSVPVQRNYRTNIFGALLTNPAEFNVVIDNSYISDDKDINDYVAEYDAEGYRVAESVEEANALLAAGETAVSVDGEHFTASSVESTVSAVAMTRTDDESESAEDTFDGVIFLLNKTVPHQKLKITGEAKTAVKVTYAELNSDEEAAPNNAFTLVVTEKASNVVLNLPEAAVTVTGKKDEEGNRASIENITISAAASATIVGEVSVEKIEKGDGFEDEIEFEGGAEYIVSDVEGFMSAVKINGATIVVKESAAIDLKDEGEINMINGQTLIVNGSLNTARAQIGIDGEGNVLTVDGTGKITSIGIAEARGSRPLNAYNGSTLIVRNISIETEQNNGGSAIYTVDADVILENIKIDCHNFALGINGGSLKADDCIFNSDSNKKVGAYSYTVDITSGCQAVLNNCEINGVQGGLSVGNEGTVATINGGKYTTTPLEGYTDQTAFYPVYIWDKGVVVVNDGEFISGCSYTIYNGNNDVPELYTWGNGACLKGGKYNKPTIDQNSKTQYPAAEGYEWVEISDDPVFKYEVVKIQ